VRHLPVDLGAAIAIVNHIRTIATRLHEILPRATKMSVDLITDRLLIQPSLAQHWEGKLVAVIVSGYDGDGAAALCGIKDVGGITIAQKLDTASQPDMPESAIASGCIDFVLSPEDIAQELVRIAQAQGCRE
jgi:two-component system, chemotaxis family, protein-glutamate methylesterase/glutaminase